MGVAASTTVHEATNKKRAGGGAVMEVLVQGNQVAFASDLLLNHYQVWSLTQLYSAGFSQSRINVKSLLFTNTQSRFALAVFDGVLGHQRLAHHT